EIVRLRSVLHGKAALKRSGDSSAMAERISETLQKKLSDRMSFYEDLGIQLFYRDRQVAALPETEQQLEPAATIRFSSPNMQKEETLPKPAGKPALRVTLPAMTPV